MSAAGSSKKASALYRTILRAHKRHLPPDMLALGNTYVQSEFRAHRTATAAQATAFVQAWQQYYQDLMQRVQERERNERGANILSVQGIPSHHDNGKDAKVSFGADMPPDLALSEEQQRQLEKLREEATKLSKD
jgi:Complex1_LYR-like